MVDRDMSCDLDDTFMTRNAGELRSVRVAQTKVMRTPGLKTMPMRQNQDIPHGVYEPERIPDVELVDTGDAPTRPVTDLAGMEIELPVVGKVNVVHAAGFVLVGFLAAKLMKK